MRGETIVLVWDHPAATGDRTGEQKTHCRIAVSIFCYIFRRERTTSVVTNCKTLVLCFFEVLQQCWWRFKSRGMCNRVDLQIVTDISKRLADYIFRDPEDGGSVLLRYVSKYLLIYMLSYPERRNCATPFVFHYAWHVFMTRRFGRMSSETIVRNPISYENSNNL